MSYFDKMPLLNYEFNINNDAEVRKIRDITLNLRFQKHLLDDITVFDYYNIQDGESPEMVANRFYGSPIYHWVVMLMNERFDVLEDWPLSSTQFERYMTDVYGSRNFRNVHHYTNENGRPITETSVYLDPYKVPTDIVCNISLDSQTIQSATPNAFQEYITNGTHVALAGIGINLDNMIFVSRFIDNSHAVISEPALMTNQSKLTFTPMIDPMKTAIPITNLEYETYVNESKRRIKLLHPTLLQSVVQQFSTLMKNG